MSRLVCITGAYGFLGRHCARHLASVGMRVVGMGYGEWPEEDRIRWGLSAWHAGAVTLDNLEALAAEQGLPSAIIHCAGGSSVGFSYEQPRDDFVRTVCSTVDVLAFSRRHESLIRVVYPSSAAVYGAATQMPISEDAPLAPVSPYGTHKLMAEECCREYARNWAVPVSIIRYFSLYGEGLRKQLLWDACRKAAAGTFSFFGCGAEQRDWLAVQDAAHLAATAMERAASDCPVVNGGTGIGVAVKDVLACLGSTFSPAQAPLFTGQAKPGDPSRQIADITRLRSWGFYPSRSWHDGVEAYAAWYQAEQTL